LLISFPTQCTVEEAYTRTRYDWMREALRAWVNRQGWADEVNLVDPPPKLSPEPIPVPTNDSSLAGAVMGGVQPETPLAQS